MAEETEDAGTSAYKEILYAVDNRVATITLNVPEKRNRLSFLMRREFVNALKVAEADDEVTVVLVRGAGPSFCAGYDLSVPRGDDDEEHTDDAPKYYRDHDERTAGWIESRHFNSWTDPFARSCYRDWMTIWELLKPVVVMVHGHCVAGGTELMSMCDIAFVADDAVIGYPAMRGMTSPDVPYFPWKLSMAHAKYLQLTGNSVSGAEAARIGWVAKSFPADQLEEATLREVGALAQIAPSLLAANKESLNQAFELMGMRNHLATAWQWHLLSGTLRPGGDEFARRLHEGGLLAALDWRDGPFRDAGIP
ncbi:MAG: enoyl-CoA hydratase-related protein [Acidimicrobiales bacterium]